MNHITAHRMLPALTGVVAALALWLLGSCSGSGSGSQGRQTDTVSLSLSQLMADPQNYVNRQVAVTGLCCHLCRHGARKAFLTTPGDSSELLRCEASVQMVGPFPEAAVGREVTLVGIVREDMLDEAAVHRMEEDHATRQALIEHEIDVDSMDVPQEQRCPTEQAAAGQRGIDNFTDQIADYRRRIAQRQRQEGKNYLSVYFLETSKCRLKP